MKVYIGKYPKHLTTKGISEKLLFWLDSESKYVNKLDSILAFGFTKKYEEVSDPDSLEHFIGMKQRPIQSPFLKLLHFLNSKIPDQKVRIHIDEYDIWNLDMTLRSIIHPCLVKLKEVKHGGCSTENGDVPLNLRTSHTINSNEDDTIFERWDWILDEMIHAFDQKSYDLLENDLDYKSKEYVRLKSRLTNGRRLFAKYYQGLWD